MRQTRITGFTIVEVLIVISIIAVLAAITVPVFMNVSRSQRQASCVNNLRMIGIGLTEYRQDYGVYPTAPLPEYLRSGDPAMAPLQKQRYDAVTTAWKNADLQPTLRHLTAAAGAGAITVEIDGTVSATTFPAGTVVLVVDPSAHTSEVAEVSAASGTTLTLTRGLSVDYPAGSYVDPRSGNFGLMTMYYLYYYLDERDYQKSYQTFHCPAQLATEEVDRFANAKRVRDQDPSSGDVRYFDPLMSGYNTYDLTYNYDQYSAEISAFDEALGVPDLNTARQLRNPNAPSDTVVCWCWGHRATTETSPVIADTDINSPALQVNSAQAERGMIREVERNRRSNKDLVLMLDGTVAVVKPTLAGASATNAQHRYYWLPTYLYAPGDWHL